MLGAAAVEPGAFQWYWNHQEQTIGESLTILIGNKIFNNFRRKRARVSARRTSKSAENFEFRPELSVPTVVTVDGPWHLRPDDSKDGSWCSDGGSLSVLRANMPSIDRLAPRALGQGRMSARGEQNDKPR
jgi:hypothetical protein